LLKIHSHPFSSLKVIVMTSLARQSPIACSWRSLRLLENL
jgi:hypothetical protein